MRRVDRFAMLVRCLAVGALCACGDTGGRGRDTISQGRSRVGGAVVSTVNGDPITVAEVQALARAAHLAPVEALRRLQAETLLMREAERRGLDREREVRHVGRQALAQALLEEEAASVEVTEKELRAAYERQHDRFDAPERRASLHVLAFVRNPDEDARAYTFIRRVRDDLAAATDVEAVWAAYQLRVEPGLKVSAERIPAVDRSAPFVKPYLDALFGVSAPSVVAQPVRTRFGWHAIAVTQIIPAARVSFEDAAGVLKPELLLDKRKTHVEAFLGRLRRDVPVRVAPGANTRAAGLGS